MRTSAKGPVSTVARKELPMPGVLVPMMSPPSICARRLLMVRPRPVPPNRLVIELSACENGLKDRGLLLGRHSDARVDHVESDVRVGPIGQIHQPHHQPHAAELGELDRVAQQIDENLPEPRGIGANRFGNQSVILDLQRQDSWRSRGPASARPPRRPAGKANNRFARWSFCPPRSSRCRECR